MTQNIKICILSELAYPFLIGRGGGGAELQMIILAKELIKRSYDVSFVTFEKTIKSYELIDGIKIYNPFNNRNSGNTYLYPQNIYKLFKILNKIDADIYIQRTTSPLTGFIGFFTRLNNKIFLYSVSSDSDITNNLLFKSVKDLKNVFFRFGVKHCSVVICQTTHQMNLLKQVFKKEMKVIKNFYPFPKIEQNKKATSKIKILWVGGIRREKRPDLFLTLAKVFPDLKFLMIGGPSSGDPEYYQEIKESAIKITNLEFKGFVPHDEIGKYYAESTLLINTSSTEGFPNTFLEAWINCIPVVSISSDPDEIICNNNLGLHSKTFDQMIEDIKTLLKNKKLRMEIGINSRTYVEENHNINKLVKEYERVINNLIVKNRL